MKIRNTAIIACALFSLSQANSVMAQGTVAVKAGTLGAGIEYIHAISPKFAVGIGFNGAGYADTIEEEEENISFDADLNMETISLLGDYHPFGNGFKVSAGIMNNGNQFDLIGTPTGSEDIEIGEGTYKANEVGSLTSILSFKSTAPYLGIGWGRAPQSGKGWGFDADLGVLFQGKPEISLSMTCGSGFDLTDPIEAAACTKLQSDVKGEEEYLEGESSEFDIFPVISLGVSYSF